MDKACNYNTAVPALFIQTHAVTNNTSAGQMLALAMSQESRSWCTQSQEKCEFTDRCPTESIKGHLVSKTDQNHIIWRIILPGSRIRAMLPTNCDAWIMCSFNNKKNSCYLFFIFIFYIYSNSSTIRLRNSSLTKHGTVAHKTWVNHNWDIFAKSEKQALWNLDLF